MNDRAVSNSGTGIPQFEPNPVANLISKFMRVSPGKLMHERDRLESKLHNNGPSGGLLPKERQRLVAVCGALTSGRVARHVAGRVACMVAALVALGMGVGMDQADGAEGVRVLTRGPVHEAFTGTVAFHPELGIVVPKAPEGGGLSAQQKPGMIDELWRQMGQLQRQIIGLEVGDTNPRATPRSKPVPGNFVEPLFPVNPRKKSGGKLREARKPEPARDSTHAAQIDQLWRQITELQKAILKLEIADLNPRLFASETLAANGNDRTEKPDTASTRNSNRISGNGPNRESLPKSLPAQLMPLRSRGGANEVRIAQLWQQISQLYKQIVALEVRHPRSYRSETYEE